MTGPPSRDPVTRAAPWAALAAFLVIVVWNAWISDDAYILLRTAANALDGHGLRWNVAERVQTFTCPLWFFVLTGALAITREAFYTPILLSALVSVVAVGLLVVTGARRPGVTALGVSILASSKAFVDYATSGLENPLTHLLLVAFFLVFLREDAASRRPLVLFSLAALVATNRPDAAILLVPALIFEIARRHDRASIGLALVGLTPLIAWETFAVVYYGFPFPNSAYAKLNAAGLAQIDTLRQGWAYVRASIRVDWVTVPTIAAVTILGFATLRARSVAVAAGLLLDLAWVWRIGGDFMSGRFFAAPLLVAVVLAVEGLPRPALRKLVVLGAAVLVASLLNPSSPLYNRWFFRGEPRWEEAVDAWGIADERAVYYNGCGLLAAGRHERMPSHEMRSFGEEDARRAARGDRTPAIAGAVGMSGYFAGPSVHVIDYTGVTDPLLARLPPRADMAHRVGHLIRWVPGDYVATIASGRNVIRNRGLHAYYDDLRLVVSGPIWSRERWRAIRDLNLGRSERLVDTRLFLYPPPGPPFEVPTSE